MKKPIPLSEVKRADVDYWEPEWFAMSPSMSTSVNMCGQKAKYWYVNGIKPRIKNITMWRGSVVHLIVELFLNGKIDKDEVRVYVENIIFNEASEIALHRLGGERSKGLINPKKDKVVRMEKDQAWIEIKTEYKIPKAQPTKKDKEAKIRRDAFDIDQFIDQCVNAADGIIGFIGPLLDSKELFVFGDPEPWIEKEIRYPLILNGEILDESNEKPTDVRHFIDLVCLDKKKGELVVIDWKVGVKRSSVTDGITPADTNAATISYAYAVLHHLPEYKKKVKVMIVRPVVNNKGELTTLEKFSKWVGRGDYDDILLKYASDAKRLKEVNLYREMSYNCTSCDYAQLCLKNKEDDYIVWMSPDELELEG